MLFFQKQPMMRRVLLAILPIYAFAGWLYGLPLLILTLTVLPASILSEFIFKRLSTPRDKKVQVTEANLVTALLYTLSLPPDVPIWVALIGIVFAIVIVKEAFGGFGRNVFNPAISGRLLIYITFPNLMTKTFLTPGNFGIDAVSSATALDQLRTGAPVDPVSLLTGIRPGSFGESALLLIVAAAIFLAVTKTANFRIIISTLAGAAILTLPLWLSGMKGAYLPVEALLSGSLIFVAVFYATDPVSAPKKHRAQWVYGILIGVAAVLIRQFSLFSEGTSFAVLLGNTFAPLLDETLGEKKA